MTDKQKGGFADLSLIIGAMLWGGSFIAVKDALKYFSPFTLMAIRFTLATVVMYAFMFKRIGRFNAGDLKYGFWLGLFSFGGFSLQTVGLTYTTVTRQGLLTSMYVVIVPFIVWLIYKNTPSLKVVLSALMAILGVFFMTSGGLGEASLNFGDILTLLSAFVYAVMIVYIDRVLNYIEPIKLVFLELPFAAFLMWVVALFFEEIPQSLEFSSYYSIIYLSIFATTIASLFQIFGQKYTAPSRASLLMTTEALFAVVFAVFLLGESMNLRQLLGMLIMSLAVVLIEFQPRRKLRFKDNESDS